MNLHTDTDFKATPKKKQQKHAHAIYTKKINVV